MKFDIDIKEVKEKAILLLNIDEEKEFCRIFDGEMVFDLIENIEDYLAEGLISHFLDR